MTSQTTAAARSGRDVAGNGPGSSPGPATGGALPTERASVESRNAEVIAAIRAHHGQLADQLERLTAAVVGAAKRGDCARERDALHQWYRTELLPHAAAEERALYSRGGKIDSTRLLVRGMLDEHRALTDLVAELTRATDPLGVVGTAVAAQSVFAVHLSKENDLLVPALDEAGVSLAEVLDGMHEILGHQHEAPHGRTELPMADVATEGGCGCGCGHGHSEPEGLEQDRGLQIGSPPPDGDSGLDVRSLPHGRRHEIIFARLDSLGTGQRLVIVNDHDPKPLRYQTSALWPDRFEWSYLEAGPETWRVAISRVG